MMAVVPRGSHVPSARRLPTLLLSLPLLAVLAAGAEPDPAASTDPAGALDRAIAVAESSLQKNDLPAADAQYREALFEGWLLVGMLERLERRMPQAREAAENAALFGGEGGPAQQALAGAWLQMGEAARAVEILGALAAKNPRDGETLRFLARALAAHGHGDAAALKLAEAGALAGDDPQLAFLVGTDFLWLKKIEAAAPFFAQVRKARPIPQTHVLIGRAYRDAGEYDLARKELLAALQQDAAVRRAHYYLGMVLLADARTGPDRLEKAMAEFREELKRAPDDPPTNDQLGLALLEAGRPAEALPAFDTAARGQPRALYVFHLGRGQLALERPAEAATSLRRALELSQEHGGSDSEIGKIHYQLGLALRKLGRVEEGVSHLAEAGRLAAGHTEGSEDHQGPMSGDTDASSPLADLPLWQRQGLKRRVEAGLVRAYFNLGVLQAQGPTSRAAAAPAAERFTRAAAFFERAAAIDAGFPQVQSSLGVAYFNARQFVKATGPLQRAVELNPGDARLKRMLATSWLNTEGWEKAAALLEGDADRKTDPALQFAYGLALLRSGRAARAEEVLAGLVAAQGDSSEIHALLGEAYEKMGKKELAREQFERARQLKERR
jgi:tetratricopeptide (TPR) repeat protein